MGSKYKIGDVVKIVDIDQFVNCRFRNRAGEMDHWAGKIMTIRECVGKDTYYMEEDVRDYTYNSKPGWIWDETMIECLAMDIININSNDLINFLEG